MFLQYIYKNFIIKSLVFMSETLNFNIFNSLILAGIIQGFVFAFIVFSSKKYKSTSTLFLAAMIFCFSINMSQYILVDTKIISNQQLFSYFHIQWALLTPVCLLFYGISLLNPDKKIKFKEKLFFLPFLIGLLLSVIYKILVAINFQNTILMQLFIISNPFSEFFSILYSQLVLVYLVYRVIKFRKQNQDYKSSTLSSHLYWFLIILICLFLLSFEWLNLMFKTVMYGNTISFYPLWTGMSVLIYWLGHIGIYKYGIQEERKKIRAFSIDNASIIKLKKEKNDNIIQFEKSIIESKRYLETDLSLDKIADEFKLSKTYLSKIINNDLGMGFNEYINSLRVEEAKNNLLNPEFSNYTLISIGLESVFNSKSVFNSVFKKHTGMTPSEFKKKNLS